MNSLDLILRRIDEEGNKAAQAILQSAQAQAEKIDADAKSLGEAQSAETAEMAERECNLILENAKSNCDSLIRREELRAKTDIINEWLKSAAEEAKNSADEEYFGRLYALALLYAHEGKGVMRLGEKDLKRLPSDFKDKINAALKEKKGEIEISEKPYNIDSGFVIEYGLIEENCSFDALLEDKTDEIKDRLFSILQR